MSTFSTFGSSAPLALSSSATLRKWTAASLILFRSRPVSRGVPLSVATRDSVAGWDVPLASGESAVSTMSTPAIAAIRLTMSPVPLVLCVCRWMGMLTVSLRRLTRE